MYRYFSLYINHIWRNRTELDPGRFRVSKMLKWSRYMPGVAQRVGRGIVLLFHDRGTRRGWVVSSTPRPQFTAGREPVHIVREAGWATGPVWTGAVNSVPTGIRYRTVQPVVSHYNDWANIPPYIYICVCMCVCVCVCVCVFGGG